MLYYNILPIETYLSASNDQKNNTSLLTEEQLFREPDSRYMNEGQLEFFRNRLNEFRESTHARIEETKKNMVKPMGISDENDRASSEELSNTALRIVDREQKLLRKIDKSLVRIDTGDYGYCLESGEPIGIPRLLARLTAEYCTEVKTLMEIKEHQYKD